MKVTVHLRQALILLSLAFITILGTHWTYINFNRKWVLFHKANELYEKKDWEGAAQGFEESIAIGLNYPKVFLKLAKAYNYQKNYPLAIHWYQRYLTAFPKDYWARKEYAGLLVATGNHDEAAKEYQMILRDEKKP